MNGYTFGMDIGGTMIKLGLFDKNHELTEKRQIATETENNGAFILKDAAAAASDLLTSRGLSWTDVTGIGAGVPGPVLSQSVVPLAANIGWKNYNVREELQKLTGVQKVSVENDAKAAALGEYWKGGWEHCRSAVMITLGTAIGGAVILNGKIVPGAFGAAGELSHIQIDPEETEACACGKFGHLQQYASAEGILSAVRKILDTSDTPSVLRGRENLTAKDVFDAAKNGDPAAGEVFRRTVRMIARMMACVSAVIDPELFLIGGGISKAGDFLIDALRKDFREIVLFTSENARIEAAKLGNDAGICGAARMVMTED